MVSKNHWHVWSLGLALFSMFFGSGNLIFPLAIGLNGGDQWTWGAAGFLLSGALLPFLGTLTMVLYRGDYKKFFLTLGRRGGFLFTALLLGAWIPFGSGARCVVLSYANIQSYLGGVPLWLYSLVYCSIVCLISMRRSRALDILGYFLTPLLLLSLGTVIYLGVTNSPGYMATSLSKSSIFLDGLVEGYQTQDLMASFFFASAIMHIIARSTDSAEKPVQIVCYASIVGISLLGIVYVGLIMLAASSGNILVGVPKDALLATLVTALLPKKLAFIGSSAVALACMTTSIALTLVFAEFIQHSIFKERISAKTAILLTVGITFGVSLLGFDGIASIISLAMQIFYPALILLIGWNLMLIKKKKYYT